VEPQLPYDPIDEARRHWTAHGWGDAADGMAAVTSLMRAQQIVQARVDEVLKPLGLTFARYEFLMLLHFSRSGAMPVTKASVRLQVHPTSVTNAVDRLQAAGLVERRPHPTDGRGTLVAITEAGRDAALTATGELNERVFSAPGLAPSEVPRLLSVLTALRRRAGDFV
jgi:DNA-binding MarR family transcriptional regulator